MFAPFPTDGIDAEHQASAHALDGAHVVIVATGSIATMYLPAWLSWFQTHYPDTRYQVVMTTSALKFAGIAAVQTFSERPVIVDSWDSSSPAATHIELAQWADGFLIHPATIDYLSRLANGLCNSPALLAMQADQAPIVAAASLPPHYPHSATWRRHRQLLADRPQVSVLEPATGTSSVAHEVASFPPVPFPSAVTALIDRLAHRSSQQRRASQEEQ